MAFLSDLLTPSNVRALDFGPGTLGSRVFQAADAPKKETKLLLLGVPEYRAAGLKSGCNEPDKVREKLFRLIPQGFSGKIMDLGDILPGNSLNDTYSAVVQVLSEINQWNIPLVFIGGSSDLITPILQTQERFEQYYTALAVDYQIDFDPTLEEVNHKNYLYPFFVDSPKFLYQYLHVGLQSYLQNQDILKFFSSVNYDATRLGKLRGNIHLSEPVFRQADLVFFDFSALKYSEAGSSLVKNPNGFYSEEFCQMARYAGFSDHVNTLGLFDLHLDPLSENSTVTAALAAELIWCFIEGLAQRKVELPLKNDKRYLRYSVFLEDFNRDIIFFKSLNTGRWWIETPESKDQNTAKSRLDLIPCGEEDYQSALSNRIPDAWWISLFRS